MALKKPKSGYFFSADVLRSAAIIGVVLLHISQSIYNRLDFLGGISWWLANFLNAATRAAVPLFIILSGYFILEKPESLSQSLKRALNRLFIPLVIWTIFYAWWERGATTPEALQWSNLLNLLYTGAPFHLYFLVIMLGLYLVTPLLRPLLKHTSRKEHHYLLLLSFGAGICLFLGQHLLSRNSPINFFTYWLPYLGYFGAGWYVRHYRPFSNQKFRLVLIYLASLLFTAGMGYLNAHLKTANLLTLQRANNYPYFDLYLAPNVVVMGLTAFVLIINQSFNWLAQSRLAANLVKQIAQAAFGIYIIHIFIIDLLNRYGWDVNLTALPLWFYLLAKWLLTFLISLAVVALAIRLPLLGRFLGAKQSR